MSSWKGLGLLLFAAVVAAAAGGIAYLYLTGSTAGGGGGPATTVPVVVANEDLTGTRLRPSTRVEQFHRGGALAPTRIPTASSQTTNLPAPESRSGLPSSIGGGLSNCIRSMRPARREHRFRRRFLPPATASTSSAPSTTPPASRGAPTILQNVDVVAAGVKIQTRRASPSRSRR
jgi:hypothetical protein